MNETPPTLPPPENPLNIPNYRANARAQISGRAVSPFRTEPECVKCGLSEARPLAWSRTAPPKPIEYRVFARTFCAGKVWTPNYETGDMVELDCGDGEEHLHLACACGHEWLTRCADQKVRTDGQRLYEVGGRLVTKDEFDFPDKGY